MIDSRRKLSQTEARTKSRQITLKLMQSIDWTGIKNASIYRSIRQLNEVDTKLIQAAIHSQWPNISLSVISSKKLASVPAGPYDLIITPVVGFDKSLNRLGMGGGFYDMFLANQPQALKIGLAYEISRIDESIAWEPHDIALDLIITDEYNYSR